MSTMTSIGRTVFAVLALAVVAVACDDDATPTKIADEPRETPETTINPWAQIFASAASLGGPVQIAFAGGDRSYRLADLDEGSAQPQDAPDATEAICTVENATDRRELDAFRQCMARALRKDACRNGGVFVLYRPDAQAPNSWRAACPALGREDDDPEDEGSRVNDPA